MPELPEVQTVVNTLRPAVVGQLIRAVTLHRQDILTPADIDFPAAITGRSIANLTRRAKRIVFDLDDGNRFYIHLGMSGRLTIDPPNAELPKHTHLILHLQSQDIRFRDPRRFGGIWWLGNNPADDPALGPEPLTLRPAQLARQLSRTRRPIKSALLDQSVVAGLGNIYVDESLFAAGIHPLRIAGELSEEEISRLCKSIKQVLRRALHHRGSTLRDYFDADGNPGGFKKLHSVYDRASEPCRRCKTSIVRIVLSGRSTCFCPTCQPPPRRRQKNRRSKRSVSSVHPGKSP